MRNFSINNWSVLTLSSGSAVGSVSMRMCAMMSMRKQSLDTRPYPFE